MGSTRLKVLEVSGYPPPHGGWSVRTEQLKKRLDADGHDCVVLNTGESRRIPSPHYETVESGRVYFEKLWRYCRRGYLVHSHANGEAPKGIALALIAELVAAVAGIGSVLTFHAGTDQVFFPREKSRVWRPIFRLLFALPRFVVCNSDAVKKRIAEYGVPEEKIVPIPAFSRQYLDVRHAELPDALERHFAKYPRSLFCYLALRAVYYPEVLLDAFARVASTDAGLGLIICGLTNHGDDAVSTAFRAKIQDAGVGDRLCLVGDLTHDQFLTAMSRSVAYVRTHVSDGVCSSILEALALGVPVVACENGTRPAGVVTFPPDDAAVLAERMRSVLGADPALRRLPESAPADIPDTVGKEIDLLASAVGALPLARRVAV